jgi:hypothetical protein
MATASPSIATAMPVTGAAEETVEIVKQSRGSAFGYRAI